AFVGAAAVLAAAISALVAYRSIELAEDSLRPYPYPFLDTQSRYGFCLFKLKNAGQSIAYRVYLQWDGDVPTLKNKYDGTAAPIELASSAELAIPFMMPGDEQVMCLGAHQWFKTQLKQLNVPLSGVVHFEDARGKKRQHRFNLNALMYEWGMYDETELLKAQHAVVSIHGELKAIRELLGRLPPVKPEA